MIAFAITKMQTNAADYGICGREGERLRMVRCRPLLIATAGGKC
jgi:hypothetical protein